MFAFWQHNYNQLNISVATGIPVSELNMHLNNQIHTEKWGSYYTSFVALLCLLNIYKKLNPVTTESAHEKWSCDAHQLHT